MNNFQRGDLVGVAFGPTPDTAAILNVTGHNLEDSAHLHDVTHTGLNGIGTARIAGLNDISGTIHADFDADAPPYLNPPRITSGTSGWLIFVLGAPPGSVGNLGSSIQRQIEVPIIVEKVHYESAVKNQVKYSFNVKMNVLAGVAGTTNPPVGPKAQ
jgi:hypothetical protein